MKPPRGLGATPLTGSKGQQPLWGQGASAPYGGFTDQSTDRDRGGSALEKKKKKGRLINFLIFLV